MADNRLELYIETLTGTAFELQVTPLETVMSIKAKIQHLEGIPVSQQHLIWQSKELCNEFSLQDYCIQDGSTLKLVLGMQGGPLNGRKSTTISKNSTYLMAELLEAEREGIYNHKPLTVVVLHDGDNVHWYSVIEEENNESESRCPSCDSVEQEKLPSAGRKLENQIMKSKMEILQKQLKNMGINNKAKNKRKDSTLSINPLNRNVQEKDQRFLPPLPRPGSIANERINLNKSSCHISKSQHNSVNLLRPGPSSQSLCECSPLSPERLPDIHLRHQMAARSTELESHRSKPLAISSSFSTTSPCICSYCRNISSRNAHLKKIPSVSLTEINDNASAFDPLPNPKTRLGDHSSHLGKPTFTAFRIKDIYHFSSVSGTPSTPSRQLRDLDLWLQSRPKTTPSKKLVYAPIEGIPSFPPQRLKKNLNRNHSHQHQWQTQHQGASVHDTGQKNPKILRGLGSFSKLVGTCSIQKMESVNENDKARFGDILERPVSGTKFPPIKMKKGKRCSWCNKKTGLATSYICRCGKNYCASHRYPELHHCSHDFKTEGRRLLQLSNPVITASKLPKI